MNGTGKWSDNNCEHENAVMFPVVSRGRPQQAAETSHGSRDTRQLAVVSLELNATPVNADDAELAGHRYGKQQRNRRASFSPLRHDTSDVRTGATKHVSGESNTSRKSAATDDVTVPSSVPSDTVRRAHRFHPVANPAAAPATTTTTTTRQVAAARLPPLLNADSEPRVNEATTTTQPHRKRSDGEAGPFEVCALRLNPDVRSLAAATRARCHHQQQSVADAAASGNKNNSMTAASYSLPQAMDGTSDPAEFDLRLPLSDNEDEEDDDEDEETAECCYTGCSADKMSVGSNSTPGITVDSCPILSVRIEFGKSVQRKLGDDAPRPSASVTTQYDCSSGSGDVVDGRRRHVAGRTHHKTRNAKAKPTSPSKAISVAGRGKVVVLDDGVYDQFARRQPPKYYSSRMFDAYVLNKRAFSK